MCPNKHGNLHVKSSLNISDLYESLSGLTFFRPILKYKMLCRSGQRLSSCSMLTDGWTNWLTDWNNELFKLNFFILSQARYQVRSETRVRTKDVIMCWLVRPSAHLGSDDISMEHWWKDEWQEERELVLSEIQPQCQMIHARYHMNAEEFNLVFRVVSWCLISWCVTWPLLTI
jgi:hypothetical protein